MKLLYAHLTLLGVNYQALHISFQLGDIHPSLCGLPTSCSSDHFLGLPQAAPILFSFGLPVCNARPIYIYIYIYIYIHVQGKKTEKDMKSMQAKFNMQPKQINMDLKKSLIIENLYNSNREV